MSTFSHQVPLSRKTSEGSGAGQRPLKNPTSPRSGTAHRFPPRTERHSAAHPCFLGTEVIRYVTRSRVRRFERFAHSIPERRYLSRFYAPLNDVLAVTFRSREQLAYGGWLNRCAG